MDLSRHRTLPNPKSWHRWARQCFHSIPFSNGTIMNIQIQNSCYVTQNICPGAKPDIWNMQAQKNKINIF